MDAILQLPQFDIQVDQSGFVFPQLYFDLHVGAEPRRLRLRALAFGVMAYGYVTLRGPLSLNLNLAPCGSAGDSA